MSGDWCDDISTVHSVAVWAVDECLLTNVDEVLAFFEKPYNYEELHAGWEEWDHKSTKADR